MNMTTYYKTILKVEKSKIVKTGDGKYLHVWVIKRCDDSPGAVGERTGSGVPCRAEYCPIGTTYETILKIPKRTRSNFANNNHLSAQ